MYPGLFFDPTIIILIPAMILAMYAQAKVSSTYSKYSNVPNQKGLTGAEAAKVLLQRQGINNVSVEMVEGHLSDHYDPRSNTVRLSRSNYSSSSIAALSVSAHEVGHAIQHSKGYAPLSFRTSLVPVVNVSSKISFPLIFIGLLFSYSSTIILQLGIILFSLTVLFQLITLPVEFNASKRANELLESYGLLSSSEVNSSKKVLNAAALTYVAAAASSILSLLRLIIILNGRQNRD